LPSGSPGNEGRRRSEMAARNHRFEVRLSKDEYNSLTKKARKAGLTTGAFVRMAVAGKEIMEAPPADLPLLIREVRRVGSNINQLLVIANTRGFPDSAMIRKAFEENRAVEKLIGDTYRVTWQ